MNTIQKYTGRSASTNCLPPTAQTTALFPIQPDKRQRSCFQSTTPLARIQVLHIKLFYTDGRTGELNITSPDNSMSYDLELQYVHIRAYLDQSAHLLGLAAYQGNMAIPDGAGLKILGRFIRVECRVG